MTGEAFWQVIGRSNGAGDLDQDGFGWGLTYGALNIANVVAYGFGNSGAGLLDHNRDHRS